MPRLPVFTINQNNLKGGILKVISFPWFYCYKTFPPKQIKFQNVYIIYLELYFSCLYLNFACLQDELVMGKIFSEFIFNKGLLIRKNAISITAS